MWYVYFNICVLSLSVYFSLPFNIWESFPSKLVLCDMLPFCPVIMCEVHVFEVHCIIWSVNLIPVTFLNWIHTVRWEVLLWISRICFIATLDSLPLVDKHLILRGNFVVLFYHCVFDSFFYRAVLLMCLKVKGLFWKVVHILLLTFIKLDMFYEMEVYKVVFLQSV
jgi:hypothetical protein